MDSLLREREESVERQRRLAAKGRADQGNKEGNTLFETNIFTIIKSLYFVDRILSD